MDEVNVFFDVMLPRLCEIRRQEMLGFRGCIVFRVRGRLPRAWTLTGGKEPWVKKGGMPKPDALVRIDEDIVKEIVQGKAPNLEKAVLEDRLEVTGDMQVLEMFQTLMDEATIPDNMYPIKG